MTDDELEAIRADLDEAENALNEAWRMSESPISSESEIWHLVEQSRVLLAEVFRLRALVGEPEWEYGVRHLGMVQTFYERFARQRAAEGRGHLVRRRKAGPWEPVPETGDDRG